MKCSKPMTDGRKRRFNGSTTCEQVLKGLNLNGNTIAVTGTSNGIGKQKTARNLALAGAHIICLNRNKELSEQAMDEMRRFKSTVKMSFIKCDLASLASVRAAAEQLITKHQKLDVLILNAGLFMPQQSATADGLELIFGVNHVGHFHLTTLLLPILERSAPSRIVVVSSEGHAQSGVSYYCFSSRNICTPKEKQEKGLRLKRRFVLYCLSKLCNLLFALQLPRNLKEKDVDVYVLHPGSMIGTNIGSSLGIWGTIANILAFPFNKSISQGASTSVYCAVHPETKEISGKYWEWCWDDEKRLDRAFSGDSELQEELWSRTEKIIQEIENR
ncbi:hypothetical protein PENTCL1PPCAC_960, partial [Pristionchus entomophagus]